MSKKSELKRAITESEEEIENLEKKRARSQSALIGAIIENRKPNDVDVEYFKTFTALIDVERENLRKLREELDGLK